jgi:ABC-type transport system substrate-binding protein
MSDITLIGPDPDAPTYLFYHSTGVRNHNHGDPEIDELLDQGRQMEVGEERNAFYQDLGRRLVDESFYIYVTNSQKPRVHTAALKGYKNHPMDVMMRFWEAWLDR